MELLNEAIQMALTYISDKNNQIENKEEVARKIGVGAILFNDLKNHRTHDIEFNLEQMLKFEGRTGPYLQYTSVRIQSLLRNDQHQIEDIEYQIYEEDHYFNVIKQLSKFEEMISKSVIELDPSILAKYSLNLATIFNAFYHQEKILVNDQIKRQANLMLSYNVKIVLDECMRLLGMEVIEKM